MSAAGRTRLGHLTGREPRRQQPTIVDPDAAPRHPESVERRGRRRDELGFGDDARLADDIDVALHELPVAALLRALGTPDGRDLNGAEDGRQLAAVARVVARERHREVEPQPEVGEVERGHGLGESIHRQTTLHDRECELFIVAAETGVQARGVFDHRCLDLVEAVRAVDRADALQHSFASRLLGGQKITHATRGRHSSGHTHDSVTQPELARRSGQATRLPVGRRPAGVRVRATAAASAAMASTRWIASPTNQLGTVRSKISCGVSNS